MNALSFGSLRVLLLLHRLEQMDKEDDSGATATALFLRNDVLVVSHIGDSCLVVALPPPSTYLSSCYQV
jgi:serine/threonine protein phosphatase PrpC